MNKSNGHKAQRVVATLATVAALAAGIAIAPSALAGSAAFDARLSSVIKQVKADPGYKKIPIDTTADREWFADESEALFKKKITKEQYVADGSSHFPGYEASFNELADLLTAS